MKAEAQGKVLPLTGILNASLIRNFSSSSHFPPVGIFRPALRSLSEYSTS